MIRLSTVHTMAEKRKIDIDKKTYVKVVNAFFKELCLSICKEPYHIKLPLSMGTIGIVRRKNKQRFVSVLDSAKTSNFVMKHNLHSNDYRVYLLWDRTTTKFAAPKFIQGAYKLRIGSKMKVLMADHACRLGLINQYYEYT